MTFIDSKYDQPLYDDEPQIQYIICSTGRSGSTLLCNLLIDSGVMGVPDEYLHIEKRGVPLCDRFNIVLNPFDLPGYFQAIKKYRTTSNGVFGVKMHFNQANILLEKKALYNFFSPATKFILISRRNKIEQAVSLTIASQTDKWFSYDTGGDSSPTYDAANIEDAVNAIFIQECEWRKFFATNNITPLEVFYEDIVAAPDEECQKVCRHVGVNTGNEFCIENVAVKKQGNSLNKEWVARFKDENMQILPDSVVV